MLDCLRNRVNSPECCPGGTIDNSPVLKRRAWSLGILHANGVPAYQPRATPWETSPQRHSPPCRGGGSFRGLRPFRAPDCPEEQAFPGCHPGLICWGAFSACSCLARIFHWPSPSVQPRLRQSSVRSTMFIVQTDGGHQAPSGAACRGSMVRGADMPLLTELERGLEGQRFYKRAAPNGAVTRRPRCAICGSRPSAV
jgi:hypothetical protein